MPARELYTCLCCGKTIAAAELTDTEITPAWEATEGAPHPLGVSWILHEQAWNLAIYSRHAESAELLLFERDVERPTFVLKLNHLTNKSGPIWHCRVPREACPDALYYAWRMDGPASAPGFNWHNFDGEKLLLDPYALAVYFPPRFNREAAQRPGSNMGQAPLGVLNVCCCDDGARPHPQLRHGHDLVIYEMHVRGFTRHESSGVAPERRGTFAGVIDRIDHLVELGVTAVELMPVFQFEPTPDDYWGYMPLNFFAPHHAYTTDPDECRQRAEFREFVRALHAAGIEVLLDVVYNHTCEGDQRGPVWSFSGIDNNSYYMTTGDPQNPYANFSGTGNTLQTADRSVRQLIVDSLRHWAVDMGVDGFRFDLASVFSRDSRGAIHVDDPPVFAQIAGEPVLQNMRLIAEPWDAGGAYQLGRSFPGTHWLQWNARFRDTLQRFVRGDPGMVPDLMTRMYGSADLFPDDCGHALRPLQSVNYIVSHDGFTLYDLTAYNQKRNWANGENNADGADDLSWNCGWEGDDHVPEHVLELRRRQVKNFFCLLMLANGAPMFRMGDEFLQTQGGNNNPFNQDNGTAWLDWRRRERHHDVFRFVCRLIAFRKSHPSLGRSRFWREDVHWYGGAHAVDMSWQSRTLAWCLHGGSQQDDDVYVMVNAGAQPVEFGIHEKRPGDWLRVVDTALPTPDDICEPEEQRVVTEAAYTVGPRAVVVLVGSTD